MLSAIVMSCCTTHYQLVSLFSGFIAFDADDTPFSLFLSPPTTASQREKQNVRVFIAEKYDFMNNSCFGLVINIFGHIDGEAKRTGRNVFFFFR